MYSSSVLMPPGAVVANRSIDCQTFTRGCFAAGGKQPEPLHLHPLDRHIHDRQRLLSRGGSRWKQEARSDRRPATVLRRNSWGKCYARHIKHHVGLPRVHSFWSNALGIRRFGAIVASGFSHSLTPLRLLGPLGTRRLRIHGIRSKTGVPSPFSTARYG